MTRETLILVSAGTKDAFFPTLNAALWSDFKIVQQTVGGMRKVSGIRLETKLPVTKHYCISGYEKTCVGRVNKRLGIQTRTHI